MFVFAEIAQRKLNTIKLFINGVETIQEIPKLIKRNGLDFILSNKVIIVMHYVKKETLIERGKT